MERDWVKDADIFLAWGLLNKLSSILSQVRNRIVIYFLGGGGGNLATVNERESRERRY